MKLWCDKGHHAADGYMKALFKQNERIGRLILSASAMMAVTAARRKDCCL
jgi:hypothetical protein